MAPVRKPVGAPRGRARAWRSGLTSRNDEFADDDAFFARKRARNVGRPAATTTSRSWRRRSTAVAAGGGDDRGGQCGGQRLRRPDPWHLVPASNLNPVPRSVACAYTGASGSSIDDLRAHARPGREQVSCRPTTRWPPLRGWRASPKGCTRWPMAALRARSSSTRTCASRCQLTPLDRPGRRCCPTVAARLDADGMWTNAQPKIELLRGDAVKSAHATGVARCSSSFPVTS
jgi:hypothetical protein